MELRGLLRRYIPEKNTIRVLAKNGGDIIGFLEDLNQNGFRLNTKKKYPPGAILEGLIEFANDVSKPHLIPFSARCIWNDAKECGFSIKEIPISEETALDRLIEHLSLRK